MHNLQEPRGIALETSRPGLLAVRVFAFTLIADQVSKVFIRSWLSVAESVPVWPGFFHLTHAENEGAAFGLMPGFIWLFVATSLGVLLGIAVFWWRVRPAARWLVVALGLVAGGSVGNLIDRVRFGRVTDFFDVIAVNFPVFNLADSAIVAGVCLLVVWVLFGPQPAEDAAPDSPDEAAEGGVSEVVR